MTQTLYDMVMRVCLLHLSNVSLITLQIILVLYYLILAESHLKCKQCYDSVILDLSLHVLYLTHYILSLTLNTQKPRLFTHDEIAWNEGQCEPKIMIGTSIPPVLKL